MVYYGGAMSFSAFNRNGRKEMTEQDIEDMKNVYSYAIKTLVSRRNMLQKKSENGTGSGWFDNIGPNIHVLDAAIALLRKEGKYGKETNQHVSGACGGDCAGTCDAVQ